MSAAGASGVSADLLRLLDLERLELDLFRGESRDIGSPQVFGGQVVRAPELMHGKTSPVHHSGQGVFAGLPEPLIATRYHSLIVDRATLPEVLEVTAWLEDGTIMGLRHRQWPHLQGVQFHPESVLTASGHALLANFLRLAESHPANHC